MCKKSDFNRVIAIKNHDFPTVDCPNRKVILLIRNPYDATKAEFNRRYGGHVGHTSEELFKFSRK